MSDPKNSIDDDTPLPDRWDQERDLRADPDDVEEPFGDALPDAAGVDADFADVFEQSLDVPDEERREDDD
jgi:hypothetical protein